MALQQSRANTQLQGTVQAANLPSGTLTTYFESSELTVTASSDISAAHSLGGVPKMFQAVLRNVTPEFGYAAGDELIITNTDNTDSAYRLTVYANSTVVGVDVGSRPFLISNRSTHGFATLTPANWRIVLRAWR